MEDLALDCSSFEHLPLVLVQLVEPCRQERPERRGHVDVVVCRHHRQHLGDEERVPARRVRDPLPEVTRDLVADQRLDLLGGQRLEPQDAGPAGAPVEQLRTRHAQEQDRSAGREQRRRLDQVEERLVSPLDVVEDDDQRRLLLEQLPGCPGDLVCGGRDVRIAEERADRCRCDRIRGQLPELLHHLHHGPVRDPVAVGKAAPPEHTSFDGGERLRHDPRLAHSGVACDGDQLATRLRLHSLPCRDDLRKLRLAPDEPGRVAAVRHVEHR